MNQPDQLTDELLSAYLDGELAGQERAQVERLLAEDPSHQQTLDELRSLSGDMQSLPRFQLGDDFYRRVVAVAEGGNSEVRPAEVLPPAAGTRSTGFGRPLIYGILALAAAVLVMVTARPSPEPQPLSVGNRPSIGERREPGLPREPGELVSPAENAVVVGPAATGEATDSKDAGAGSAGPDLVARTPGQVGSDLTTTTPPVEGVGPSVAQLNRVGTPEAVVGNSDPAGGRPRVDTPAVTPSGPAVLVDNSQRMPTREAPQLPQTVNGLVQYLFIVEVDLNAEATRSNLFHNALKGHGIQFSDDLKVDRELEVALLSSRMLTRVQGAPENGAESELVYVVAAGHQIDSAIRHLGRSGQVQRLRFDMGIKPSELDVFHKLRVADARDRDQRAELASEMGRARRLLLNLAILSPAARQLGGQGLLGNAFGNDKGLLPGDKPPTRDDKTLPGANEIFEVLFLVRGTR